MPLDLRTTFTQLFRGNNDVGVGGGRNNVGGTNGTGATTTTTTTATTSTTSTANVDAGVNGLRDAGVRLRAGLGDPIGLGAGGTVGNKTLHRLKDDLNKNLIDDSPFVVTKKEVLDAHQALLSASPQELSATLRDLPAGMLSAYVGGLADAKPFSLADKSPPPLREFALRLARDVDGPVGASVIANLDDAGKRRLMEGVLQLDGGDVAKLRANIGDAAFAQLARGGKPNSLVGDGVVAGRLWKDNVTDEFKTKYAQAAAGTLTLPQRAKDTVFLTGPGLFGDELPGYLEPNRKALEEMGVPSANISKMQYNTADSPQANADKIYAAVKQAHDAGKHVVVMGHSKFGRDMLEAFARHPDLKSMVDGAVMMQPAIEAPIADDLKKPQLQRILDPVLAVVGGNRGAFEGMAERAGNLPPWPSDVPTMVFASSTESSAAMLAAGAGPYYEHIYNAASDGAVAFQDQAALNGAHLVTLPGLADHAMPGLKFVDVCEHFAKQLDAGAPDDVIKGILDRLRGMSTFPGAFDAVIKLYATAHNDPAVRARSAKMLRDLGPMLDDFAKRQNDRAGFPLVDNHAMTKALVSQLFDKMQ